MRAHLVFVARLELNRQRPRRDSACQIDGRCLFECRIGGIRFDDITRAHTLGCYIEHIDLCDERTTLFYYVTVIEVTAGAHEVPIGRGLILERAADGRLAVIGETP